MPVLNAILKLSKKVTKQQIVVLLGIAILLHLSFGTSPSGPKAYNGPYRVLPCSVSSSSSSSSENFNRNRKTILLWNENWTLNVSFDFSSCPAGASRECLLTNDRASLSHASAIIVQDHTMDPILPAPPSRCRDQLLVYMNLESFSPTFSPDTHRQYPFNFNWTLTFRQESDMQMLYSEETEVVALPLGGEVPYKPAHIAPAIWAATNCNPANNRTGYVDELLRYMPIDIYGTCRKNRESILVDGELYVMPDRLQHISEQTKRFFGFYKFALAFENRNCRDYVTEKYWRALAGGVVPVVLGANNIEDFAPAPHSIIKVSDFPSPRKLAEYLIYLSVNNTAYMEYHAWRKLPFSQLNPSYRKLFRPHLLCRMCERLHEEIEEYRWYNDEELFHMEPPYCD